VSLLWHASAPQAYPWPLSGIIVGQNIQALAADTRAENTYKDAEAVLAEAIKIQEHLAAQRAVLTRQDAMPLR
jgi:hypothetical protein